MALTVTHPFVSLEPAKTDPAEVGGSDWNANHSLSGTLPILNGGTGAATEADARTNLGLGTLATQNANNVSISGGSISGITLSSLDSNTTIQDNADPTKQMKFELSGISAGQTRTLTVPDASTTLVGQDTADSLTNKVTVDTTNLEVSNLKAKDGTAAGTITDVTGIVTLNSAVLTTADINGGTIDGVALGGSAAVSLGTPSSGTLTNCTGLPVSTGISGLGTGVGTFLATPSSANLAAAVTDETGTGALVFGTSPTLGGTPVINTTASVGGTWTAAATWTLPAHTLGGTVTSNGQSFSGTIANLGTVTTVDLNGGTIDGTVIGGASAAAGTFTTLTSTGNAILGDTSADAHTLNGTMTVATAGEILLDDSITSAGAALPLAFDGDADTGLFRPAANTIAIATGSTERMRIDSAGRFGFGTTSLSSGFISIRPDQVDNNLIYARSNIQSAVTDASQFYSNPLVASGAALTSLTHFFASPSTFTGTVTTQYGFHASSGLTAATNNYGFYSNIASGTGRWNFYANGTASNYFGGQILTGSAASSRSSEGGAVNISCGDSGLVGNVSANGDELVVENNGNAGITILTPNTASGTIYFGDQDSATVGYLAYSHTTDSFTLNRLLDLSTSTAGQIKFPATQNASADANTLDDYREATFTATATGMTTAPTGTATFVRAGNKITLDIPTISGTSNAVTFTLTGMPTTCRPSATRTVPVRVQDNTGAIAWGMAQIDSAGVITLYKDAASGAFTGSGTKSINTCSVAYVI